MRRGLGRGWAILFELEGERFGEEHAHARRSRGSAVLISNPRKEGVDVVGARGLGGTWAIKMEGNSVLSRNKFR